MDRKDSQHQANKVQGERQTAYILSRIRGKTLFSEIVGGTPNDPCYGPHLPSIVIDVNGNSTWIAITSPDDDLTRSAVKMLLEAQETKRELNEKVALLERLLPRIEHMEQKILEVTNDWAEKFFRSLLDASDTKEVTDDWAEKIRRALLDASDTKGTPEKELE